MLTIISDDLRKRHEQEHGKKIASQAASVWGHSSPAGRRRVKRRISMMIDLIKPTPNTKIVELGCGTGIFTSLIAKIDAKLVAVDISSDLLNEAKKNVNAHNITFVEGDCMNLEKIPLAAGADAIVANSVLHHLNYPLALKSIYLALKPGGLLILSEPNMANPQIMLQKNIPWLKKMAGDSPDETAFWRWSLKRLLTKTGFVDVRVTPFDFLHPATPGWLVKYLEPMGKIIEKIPAIKEIAGSLFIVAKKQV